MAETGWRFAAELSELRMVGAVDLPAMAYTFAELNNLVDQTNPGDDNIFGWEAGGMSQVLGPWSALRNQLQNLLGQTSQHLEVTAHAVLQIVQIYADTDAEAAQSLKNTWSTAPTRVWGAGHPPLLDGEHEPPGPAPDVVLKPDVNVGAPEAVRNSGTPEVVRNHRTPHVVPDSPVPEAVRNTRANNQSVHPPEG